jgi:hypothetical protein
MDNEAATAWLTVAKAAPRLGLTPDGLRSRIKRGQIRARRGNDGRLVVGVPLNGPDPGHEPGHEPAQDGSGTSRGPELNGSAGSDHALLVALKRAARAEGELAAEVRRSTELQARADRLEAALAEARKGWLERLLEAVRRR